MFRASVIFKFSNMFNRLKHGLQVELFLRLNTAVQIYINIYSLYHRVYGFIKIEKQNFIKTNVFEYEYYILE